VAHRAGTGEWAPPGPSAEHGVVDTASAADGEPIATGLHGAGTGAGGGARGSRISPRGSRRPTLLALLGLAAAVAAASTVVALLAQTHPITPVVPPAIPAVPSADAIGDVQMFSQSTGWAQRLSDGAVLHTTHGVQRWTVASPPPTGQLVAVAFVGPEVARVITVPTGAAAQTTLQSWATQDGGATWTREGSLGVQGFDASVGGALDFLDPEHGWFSQIEVARGVAGTALFRTADGGAHWTEVAATSDASPGSTGVIPDGCDVLTATFSSVSTGWMTGTCLNAPPPFYVTRDGGLTWVVAPLSPLPAGFNEGTSFPPTFTSSEGGTLLTENDAEAGVTTSLFATTDGGLSWELRSTSAGAPVAADFLGARDGWLVTDGNGIGSAPELYTTGDGGSTWTRVNAFPYEGLSLDFLSPQLGWASADLDDSQGGPTYLVQTQDGGRSWSAVLPRLLSPSPSP
jgi:photosystem II stability/assembly factor-like uncharacterized protein